MMAFHLSSVDQRRPWHRRWLERRAVDRRPVSVARQRAGVVMLALIVLGVCWYTATTRDQAIQRRAVAFLEDVTACEVHVAGARFSMFGGITLRDVLIATPPSAELDPSAADPAAREIVSARTIQLLHNPWLLLLGKLRVEEIVAVEPRIRLMQNVDTGMRNWQLLGRADLRPAAAARLLRPQIRIRGARATVGSIYRDGRRPSRDELLDADVRPHPTSETGYCIEVRRYSDPAERVMVVFDPGAKIVTNAPYVDAETVRLQLPMTVQQLFDQIDLKGEVKLTRLFYGPTVEAERDTEIRLRNVRCRIPLSILRSGAAAPADGESPAASAVRSDAAESVVTMTGVQGRLQLRGTRVELTVSGQVNDATCHLEGTLDISGEPFDETGIDVHLTAAALPAPEGPMRARLVNDPSVPFVIRSIFGDFDPHGVFDVDLQLKRPPGADANLDLHGTLRPLGVRARSAWFPYTVTDLTGLIRFRGPLVAIEHLHGRHGPAAIWFRGLIDQRRFWSDVSVDIRGRGVPLDGELHDALSAHHQDAWRRISPDGTVDLDVWLRRSTADEHEPEPDWHTRVDVDPVECAFSLGDGYVISDVCGKLSIDDDLARIDGLTGRRGDAGIGIDGWVAFHRDDRPEAALHIRAENMTLDPSLASILPPEGRGAFAQFQPGGRVDVDGHLLLRNDEPAALYDLRLALSDGLVCYQGFPYRVEDIRGDMEIRPEGVSILRAEGRHGAARVGVFGDVHRRVDGGYTADLNLSCDALPLDDDLYAAMPTALQAVWRSFDPRGVVEARSQLHCDVIGDRVETRHRTRLLVRDGAARFERLPLPVSHLSADLSITDRRVEVHAMTGRVGGDGAKGGDGANDGDGGLLRLQGDIDLSGAEPAGVLSIAAVDWSIDDALVGALPADLGAALRAARAAGRFDLRLDPVVFEPDGAGRFRWSFQGDLSLRGARADLGMKARGVDGRVSGGGRVDHAAGVSLDLATDFETVSLGGWPLRRLTSRLTMAPGSRVLEVSDAAAELYGGQIAGVARVTLGPEMTRYRASITAHDLQLGDYLQEAADDDEARRSMASGLPSPAAMVASNDGPRAGGGAAGSKQPVNAQGDVYGNLIIRGRSGRGAFREGAGEVYVRSAQVWRLPLVFAIFQVLNLTPDENVFHDGRLKLYLSGDELTFQSIDLQGRAVSFVGGGHMNLTSRELDVTLLARSPVRIRVPLLTDLLEGASREFMEVRLRGTVEAPTILPQPLKSLKQALRTLFPPPPPMIEPRPIDAAAQGSAGDD